MRKNIVIRQISENDAREYLELATLLDNESVYRAYEPGERNNSPATIRSYIAELLNKKNNMIFLAFYDTTLCGYLEAIGGTYKRTEHSVHINLAVLKKYQGLGMATLLFEALFEWAVNFNIHRIDLSVVTDNSPAINLYKKTGFETEGIKRHSFLVANSYMDEYLMSKII
ncbi:MAG: GNAT family N-acetyltransferase [Ignavibacteriales bacterium]|jgi:RimJ/RimL family protein N-acetyltransferase|nr:GNAT family N-acetyltransferase [Ignavibacteriales bacterium]HOJ17548.1 GNAT family N-acetyltransferase [Ignavibacteriaceae bacterium]HPO56179.1 GNAT family N-acetyltransferase [Ignavibacteriaceae bacterium]